MPAGRAAAHRGVIRPGAALPPPRLRGKLPGHLSTVQPGSTSLLGYFSDHSQPFWSAFASLSLLEFSSAKTTCLRTPAAFDSSQ